MVLREQDKHFLWSLYNVVAIIFLWKGIWEGIYEIPVVSDYIGDPFIYLFIGFAILTFSGIIFKEFDPLGGVEKAVNKILHYVQHHPQKQEFTIKYQDKNLKREVAVPVPYIKGMEKGVLIVENKRKHQELFIPIHRVTEVLHKGKTYWKL